MRSWEITDSKIYNLSIEILEVWSFCNLVWFRLLGLFVRFGFFDNWLWFCFKCELIFFHFDFPVRLIINEMRGSLILKLATFKETVIDEVYSSCKRRSTMPTIKPLSVEKPVLYQHKPVPPYLMRLFLESCFPFRVFYGWLILTRRWLVFILEVRQYYFGHSWKKMSASLEKLSSVHIEDMILERVDWVSGVMTPTFVCRNRTLVFLIRRRREGTRWVATVLEGLFCWLLFSTFPSGGSGSNDGWGCLADGLEDAFHVIIMDN